MRSYHDQMKDLRFTPEQKAAMVATLLAAGAEPKRRTPRRKRVSLLAAAVLAAALCAACASGALQAVIEGFSEMLGASPAQTKTIETITRPLGTSATCDGVTISAEGVMGDNYTLYIFYSMYREDGQPVLPQTEDTKNVSNGDNTLMFEENTFSEQILYPNAKLPACIFLGKDLEFADFQVDDTVLYFMQTFAFTVPGCKPPTCSIDITFEDLYSHEWYSTRTPQSEQDPDGGIIERDIPLVEGTWSLSFNLDYKGAAIDLPAGQTFHAETYHKVSLTGTLREIQLSPIALHLDFDYTVDTASLSKRYHAQATEQDFDRWLELELWSAPFELDYCLNLTDGTTVFLFPAGATGIAPSTSRSIQTFIFEKIIPLDTIESITIGDLTIPVKQAGGK